MKSVTHIVPKDEIGKVEVFAICNRKIFKVAQVVRRDDKPSCTSCAFLQAHPSSPCNRGEHNWTITTSGMRYCTRCRSYEERR